MLALAGAALLPGGADLVLVAAGSSGSPLRATMGLAEDLQDETAEVLAKLIRFKTVIRRATSANASSGSRRLSHPDAGLECEL